MLQYLLALSLLSAPAAPDCHVGAYRLDNGSSVDIAASTGGTLRWRKLDGSTGQLGRDAAGAGWVSAPGWMGEPGDMHVTFGECGEGRIRFDGTDGKRIDLQVRETAFAGHDGTRLVGRLLLPPGDGEVPVVVLVHGSERSSALAQDWMQRLLPAAGVGAFVYDKRGTGNSSGSYTQDFDVLADDAMAAAATTRRLAGTRLGRLGFRGASQGGWVAPLAATRTPADFVIVVFGLAVSPLEEDHEAVAFQMRAKGYGMGVIEQAWEVSDAAGAMVASQFADDEVEAFIAARDRYRDKSWYPDLRGNITQFVLPLTDAQLRGDMTHLRFPMSEAELREHGPVYVVGTPFHYDSLPVLREVDVPQLWVLGGQDRDAPSAETLRRLHRLAANGEPITTALFPGAEHGMTLFEIGPDGQRVSTRYPQGYLRMLLDFARDGRLHGEYGNAEISGPAMSPAGRVSTRHAPRRRVEIRPTRSPREQVQ